MQNTIEAIDQLRESMLGKDLADTNNLATVANYISENPTLNNTPALQAFVKDIKTPKKIKRLKHVKTHINKQVDNLVFSAFNAPYFKDLSLDAFYYHPLPVPQSLCDKLQSPVLPVKIIKATQGFYSKPVVALFPENHIDNVQLAEDKIFYFIDKFVERFYRVTKPLLAIVNKEQLITVRTATEKDIERASVYWVCLHEYFHRQGHLPIPDSLDIKSTRALAGLEELRVDILSILYCIDNPEFIETPKFIAEFILTERLLRYSVEGIPTPNYDAIASQVLFSYLLKNGGINIDDKHIITLQPKIFSILREFHNEIDAIEATISSTSKPEVKKRLLNFVNTQLEHDGKNNQYVHNSYFSWVKAHFNV